MAYIKNIVIENARIVFRNFSGKASQFNPTGKRTFALILDQVEAECLSAEGWNVKYLRPREEGDDPTPYINVNVRFSKENPERDPDIYMVTGRKKTRLSEDTVGTLDFAEIVNIDLVVTPYRWNMNGRQGITAYLKKMYCTIEDDFGGKYDFEEDEHEEN